MATTLMLVNEILVAATLGHGASRVVTRLVLAFRVFVFLFNSSILAFRVFKYVAWR